MDGDAETGPTPSPPEAVEAVSTGIEGLGWADLAKAFSGFASDEASAVSAVQVLKDACGLGSPHESSDLDPTGELGAGLDAKRAPCADSTIPSASPSAASGVDELRSGLQSLNFEALGLDTLSGSLHGLALSNSAPDFASRKRGKRTSSERLSRRKDSGVRKRCYMEYMGIDHYCQPKDTQSSSTAVATERVSDHSGKRKRLAQVFLCAQCASVVERGGVFKTFNVCLRRSKRKAPQASTLPVASDPKPTPAKRMGANAPGRSVNWENLLPSSGAQCAKDNAAVPGRAVEPDEAKTKALIGCRVRVNQEDSLRANGWETWLVHPESENSMPANAAVKRSDAEKGGGGDNGLIIPVLEGMCLSLDKTNRKAEASKVTRNRRNLTKRMLHKIDTLTIELRIHESEFKDVNSALYGPKPAPEALEKLRELCCKKEQRNRRPNTLPSHVLILAVERAEGGTAIVHYQNLLPEFNKRKRESDVSSSQPKAPEIPIATPIPIPISVESVARSSPVQAQARQRRRIATE